MATGKTHRLSAAFVITSHSSPFTSVQYSQASLPYLEMLTFIFLVLLLHCCLTVAQAPPRQHADSANGVLSDLPSEASVSNRLLLPTLTIPGSSTASERALMPRTRTFSISHSQGHGVSDDFNICIDHMVKHGAIFAFGNSTSPLTGTSNKFMVAAKFRLDRHGVMDQFPIDQAIAVGQYLTIEQCFIILPNFFSNTLSTELLGFLRLHLNLAKDLVVYYFWLHPTGIAPNLIAEYSYTMEFDRGLIQQKATSIDPGAFR